MRNSLLIPLVAILSIGLIGCGSQSSQTQAFNADFQIVIEDEVKQYDPMQATVTGDHGTITVTNQLDAEHGFVISEFGIKEAVPPGETMSFDVESASPGEYMVDCHLHSAHAEATLTVQAP